MADDLQRRAFELERKRQLNAAELELRDVFRVATQIQQGLRDGSATRGPDGRRLITSAALLLERLSALDAIENVSYLAADEPA